MIASRDMIAVFGKVEPGWQCGMLAEDLEHVKKVFMREKSFVVLMRLM